MGAPRGGLARLALGGEGGHVAMVERHSPSSGSQHTLRDATSDADADADAAAGTAARADGWGGGGASAPCLASH